MLGSTRDLRAKREVTKFTTLHMTTHKMPIAQKQHKKSLLPPINHWHSTCVVTTALILFMVGAGVFTNTGAGMLAVYGTSNWVR
jgi:hypothetical protein